MNAMEIPMEWLPRLPRRYAATAVDGLLILAAMIIPTIVLPSDTALMRGIRIAVATGAILVYEPICTGRFVTLGQWAAGVRVRRFDTGVRIGLLRAYGRLLIKGFLGFISFFSLAFTPGRRALHDMATGSIVIMAAAEPSFVEWTKAKPKATT